MPIYGRGMANFIKILNLEIIACKATLKNEYQN